MKFSVAALIAVLCACASASAFSDADILNFALNLECLEAEFYVWSAYGHGLNAAQRGGGPPSIGGKKANLGDYQAVAEEIANNEIKHVELLRAALGDAAVPCPKIDIGPAFSAAANAALGTTLSPAFDVYNDQLSFLIGSLLFEDTGVNAYNGAIGVIKSPAYLSVARSIMAVEAYHAGAIRLFLAQAADVPLPPYQVPVSTITLAVSKALDSLLMLPRNQPVGSLTTNPNLFLVDSNALAFAVTPPQVLNVVYLSTTAKKGGFFPAGVNGLLGKTRGELTDTCTGQAKAARYKQCGGLNFTGPTCCEKFNTCVKKSDYYSHCEPTPPPASTVPWYGQCGGQNYQGPSKCEAKSTCTQRSVYYSQCVPSTA